jgi:transcriptional regulator with XRE-family HTH domain
VECGKRNISIDNIERVALTLKVDAYLLFIDGDKQHPPILEDAKEYHISSKRGISDEPGNGRAKTGGRHNKL